MDAVRTGRCRLALYRVTPGAHVITHLGGAAVKDAIQFAILGLGAGAAYTLLAEGIVLIYRGSGIVNFAHGGIAMFARSSAS